MQLTLAIGTCERAASLVLMTACALLPRRRQPRLRAIGHDGHLALDISATRPVGATSTPQSRLCGSGRRHANALPHGPGGADLCLLSRARASSRLRPLCGPVGALLDPLTINSGPVDSVLVIGAMRTKGVVTPAPPLATGPPHHRLSHDASPHSPV